MYLFILSKTTLFHFKSTGLKKLIKKKQNKEREKNKIKIKMN